VRTAVWMMKARSLFKRCAIALCIFALTFYVHSALEKQHYARCKSNIIRVMLYGKSDMCVQLERVLTAIECVCSKDVFGMVGALTSVGSQVLGGMLS
jgi:hypothetical protein